MAEDLEIGDSRVEFMAGYLMKTLKLKNDKWHKMYGVEDNKILIQEFVEKADQQMLVFILNPSGALTVQYTYPTASKTKAVYFVKKNKEGLTKDLKLSDALIYGDLSYSPLDQLSAILDEVCCEIFLFFYYLDLLKNYVTCQ